MSSVVLGVCSGILQLVCSVVGTFSTAGSIALGEAAGLGSQVGIAVVTGSVPSIVCSLLASIIYSGLTYILMVGGIRVYLKLCAGEKAGTLTEAGARLLDESGTLKGGIPMCPPEGDAGTGMAATNSVAVRTGNVSAGDLQFQWL